jgi:hypothetical protein
MRKIPRGDDPDPPVPKIRRIPRGEEEAPRHKKIPGGYLDNPPEDCPKSINLEGNLIVDYVICSYFCEIGFKCKRKVEEDSNTKKRIRALRTGEALQEEKENPLKEEREALPMEGRRIPR